MGGGPEGGEDEMISGINVTPLVDITLVLLIIFMVTATYIVRQVIPVQLPKAAHGGELVGKTLMVVVLANGGLVVDGAPASDSELVRRVRAAKAEDPEVKAVIAADQESRHRSVVHVIDLLKGEGISKFALNVEREEQAPAAVPPAAR
ncbi:MAG: ExbD/TolR family protein [Deltaproteobacteria bacterium]